LVNSALTTQLRPQLQPRLWRDELAKMPRHLYPERSEAALYRLWQWEYRAFFKRSVSPAPAMLEQFAPVDARQLRPRYLADSARRWYALFEPRVNHRTGYSFCYVRYWWAVDAPARQAMVQAVLSAWQNVSFDWLKLRVGYGSALTPADFHPRARWQNYVVAGVISPQLPGQMVTESMPNSLSVQQPERVGSWWWPAYRALLDEQEQLAPDLEDWNDYGAALQTLRQETAALLAQGGGVINLWQADTLVGHISWRPEIYPEQLIERCWHVSNIIVKASHRRQGLGQLLHSLAAQQMNLVASPLVVGLITAGNKVSLKTAAKMGRDIVDSYLIIPNLDKPDPKRK